MGKAPGDFHSGSCRALLEHAVTSGVFTLEFENYDQAVLDGVLTTRLQLLRQERVL